MTSIKDYKDSEGNLDWNAYQNAKKANGEICTRCGTYILWGKGYPQECHDCKDAKNEKELRHDKFIRCPQCRHLWDPFECEMYEVLTDDNHDVCCVECDYHFTMTTYVSYSFTSPALGTEEPQ